MQVDARMSPVIQLNVPEWYKENEFLEWLNSKDSQWTCHKNDSEVSEWTEVFVTVDPGLSGDGSEEGVMPDQYWNKIISICEESFSISNGFHIIVRLMNEPE
jgi:hypothetical protein